jgi:hypothetical protein
MKFKSSSPEYQLGDAKWTKKDGRYLLDHEKEKNEEPEDEETRQKKILEQERLAEEKEKEAQEKRNAKAQKAAERVRKEQEDKAKNSKEMENKVKKMRDLLFKQSLHDRDDRARNGEVIGFADIGNLPVNVEIDSGRIDGGGGGGGGKNDDGIPGGFRKMTNEEKTELRRGIEKMQPKTIEKKIKEFYKKGIRVDGDVKIIKDIGGGGKGPHDEEKKRQKGYTGDPIGGEKSMKNIEKLFKASSDAGGLLDYSKMFPNQNPDRSRVKSPKSHKTERKLSERKASERKTSERKTSERKTSHRKESERKKSPTAGKHLSNADGSTFTSARKTSSSSSRSQNRKTSSSPPPSSTHSSARKISHEREVSDAMRRYEKKIHFQELQNFTNYGKKYRIADGSHWITTPAEMRLHAMQMGIISASDEGGSKRKIKVGI